MTQRLRIRAVGILVLVPGLIITAVAWHYGLLQIGPTQRPQNSLLIIAPYLYQGTWVFDDETAGLVREPFVGGVPAMIDELVSDVPDADSGFRLLFSSNPFPGHNKKLTWLRGDAQGNYYELDDPKMEGWICPALFKYYDSAPKELYVKAEPVDH